MATATLQQRVGKASSAASDASKVFSLAEVQKHCSQRDAWVVVHGKVLDITDFIASHPGGDLIVLAAGSDATVLFETYHPQGISSAVTDKLFIGDLAEGDSPSYYTWDSPFYPTLRKRVVAKLREMKQPRRGSVEIWIKAVLLLTCFWTFLAGMSLLPFPLALLASIGMGVSGAFIGTCIQHDGNHGAFSTFKPLNKAAGWTLDMIGASAFTWEIQHMLGHHPFTNVLDVDGGEGAKDSTGLQRQESDPDVFSSFPLMRFHPYHQRQWYHQYQHIYAPLLFSMMTMAKVFMQDFEMLLGKKLYHLNAECRYGEQSNVNRFWAMKAISMTYMLLVPMLSHGLIKGLTLFVLGHMACGELLATMFIVNHVIDGVAFVKREDGPEGPRQVREFAPRTPTGLAPMEEVTKAVDDPNFVRANDWAAVQCQTSVNWAAGSWFWNHFSGGLSHQIEHHLFPSICHTNYVHIQPVVEATCKEFGVPYRSEPSLYVACQKMFLHLWKMGHDDSHAVWQH